ncbi:hypothetical protein O181_096015 [Austropuccinia psidii MF-1]|uniref:Retroviral polymerase SH3-like domain-containing protein n=1 Tax=Austropuccinia psidii MF-1 TaxID=1389203 RepID=A0A9Q3J6T7_9BASI|nr:hypothetical protein [Austropuccinia psidii MF-1]
MPATLSYENEASSYCILRLSDQKIIISRHVIFDEEKFPSLSSEKQITEEIFRIFPNSTQIIEEETPANSNSEENFPSIESISVNDKNEDFYVDALEQQPQRIRVIGPRHPTLISSKINSNNILPFTQRQPRENLTSQVIQSPKTFNKAMTS